MSELLDRISIDPTVCGGKPCIRGTRIWVSLVLDMPATGMSEAELRAEYPALNRDDILAAIAYGAEIAREQVIPVNRSEERSRMTSIDVSSSRTDGATRGPSSEHR
jgi:uncharacterized protein (DUF433 family)